jgi:hypothetical protein
LFAEILVYKPIDTPNGNFATEPLTVVPESDPDYDRLPWAALGPWAWTLSILFGSMGAAIVTGAIWNYSDAKRAKVQRQQQQEQRQQQESSSRQLHSKPENGPLSSSQLSLDI